MIGKVISHYKILEKLGCGGMGLVYKAEDVRLNRMVALKFLPQNLTRDEESRKRFIHEAKAASALDHPNICTIHEIDQTDDGQIFICMACYEGKSLKEMIVGENGPSPLPIASAIDITSQIAQGLAKAHAKGIIHRDIKPANILISEDNQVKIVDFGLAKLAGATMLTKEGTTLGTAAYMSPEQAQGSNVDYRTDIWSLGVVLFEMLTGQLPFKGDYEQAIAYGIVNEEPKPISRSQVQIPPVVPQIVYKCLQKNVDRRYQSAAELLTDLKNTRDELFVSNRNHKPPKASWRQQRTMKKSIGIIGVAFLLFVLLLLFTWGAWEKWTVVRKIPPQKQLAILPFTTIGGDAYSRVICDGLVETLTSKMSQIEHFQKSLWVLPASEVYSSGVMNIRDLRHMFDVNLAVTGSFQRMGDSVRITVNLVDTKHLRQLRSQVITEKWKNLSKMQDEVGLKFAEMLNLEIMPTVKTTLAAGSTAISSAYELYLLGRGHLKYFDKAENIDQAISYFEKAVAQDTSYALAYAGLGEAYWRKYQMNEDVHWAQVAADYCRKAVSLNRRLPMVYLTLGLINSGTGNYEKALQNFQEVLKYSPDNSDAYRETAHAFEAVGDLSKAEQNYKKAIALHPNYWANYNELGKYYYRLGHYEDAVKQFEHVIALRPDNINGYNNLGSIYFYLHRQEEAQNMFQRSLKVKESYAAYANLGTLYFYGHDFARAAAMYEKALEIVDTDYTVWANLASAYYWGTHDVSRAEKAYARAIALAKQQLDVNPTDQMVLADLAAYYARLKNKLQATTYLKKVLATNPQQLETMVVIADVYEQLGDRDTALSWIEKVLHRGYSSMELEKYPGFANLRQDERYIRFIQNTP